MGMAALSDGLAVNHSLQNLDLSNNQLSHDSITRIACALLTNKSLTNLGEAHDFKSMVMFYTGIATFFRSLKQHIYDVL